MSNEFVAGLHFVKVFPPNPYVGTEFQMWVAATGADQALDAVLKKFPPGWRGEHVSQSVTKELAGRLKLRPGDVCEISSGST
jgi:hypothetical protein